MKLITLVIILLFVNTHTNAQSTEAMIETDTAIQSETLIAEYYLLYGSAALQETFGIHKKIEKNHF